VPHRAPHHLLHCLAHHLLHKAPHHALLLNKFNVVPHHLLLVTRAFQHQTEQLSPADFEALLTTLRAFPTPGGLAFMNIGDASGFSQPHKHVQLVPLPFSQELPHAPVPIGPLVERAAAEARRRAGAGADPLRFDVRALPFRNACVTLSNDATPEQLAGTYDEVLSSLALKAPAASFNLLMTSAWLMLIPRSAEHGNGVAVNALGFAGTMLVRSRKGGGVACAASKRTCWALTHSVFGMCFRRRCAARMTWSACAQTPWPSWPTRACHGSVRGARDSPAAASCRCHA
jgi:ATP adenylyltransferase/5',5'''-P-1,P-4-tetraphosphate phosphorylase II